MVVWLWAGMSITSIEALKWTLVIIYFIIYTTALAAGTSLRPSKTLYKVTIDFSFIYLQSTQTGVVCVVRGASEWDRLARINQK